MMMFQCWESVPDKRPSFKILHTQCSKIIEGMAGYLEMQFNPFTTEAHTEEKKEEQITEDKSVEEIPVVTIAT